MLNKVDKNSGIVTIQENSDRLIGEIAYLKAGSYKFEVPNGVDSIYVAVLGAGGSGGSGSSAHATGGGGGGFAGGYLKVISGESYNVTVGSGGAGVAGNNIKGNAGGSSSFGNLLTATGGSGGRACRALQLLPRCGADPHAAAGRVFL